MTKQQELAISKIKREVERQLFYSENCEIKEWQVTENEYSVGVYFVVGLKNDEHTLAEFYARDRGHVFIGKKGGLKYVTKRGALRRLKNYNIEFERNVNMFFNKEFNDKRFSKSEIDIVIYDNNFKEKCAIELKYPRKKAYYKRMGLFLQDIDFINELKKQLKFQGGFVLTFVDKDTEQGFYKGKYKENTRQAIFRSNGNILYKDKYSIYWKNCKDNLKYYLLRV